MNDFDWVMAVLMGLSLPASLISFYYNVKAALAVRRLRKLMGMDRGEGR